MVPWPLYIQRHLDTHGCPVDRVAVMSGTHSLAYCSFMRMSLRIRDLMHELANISHGTRVLVAFGDSYRISFACVVTALAMLGAPFTLLDQDMTMRARDHVVEMFRPDIYIEISADNLRGFLMPPRGSHLTLVRIFLTDSFCLRGEHVCKKVKELHDDSVSSVEQWVHFEVHHNQKSKSDNDETTKYLNTAVSMDSFQRVRASLPPATRDEFWCWARAHDVAFVDWTSGSSGGLPKGAPCKHSTLSNMMLWKWGLRGPLNSESVVNLEDPTVSPKDQNQTVVGVNLFGLWYWWQPLCIRSTTVLLTGQELKDLPVLFSAIQRLRINVLDCITPSLLQVMIAVARGDESSKLPRIVLVSGEPLPVSCIADFHDITKNRLENVLAKSRLLNIFSTTETGDSAFFEASEETVPELLHLQQTYCPIGTPASTAQLTLTDDGLVVGGIDSHGYLNDVEATRRGFDARGWISHDQGIRIRLGGREMISIIGRLDDCVKIRGFKVDLKAVEDAILASGNVVNVCAVQDIDFDALVVFVVLRAGVDESEIPHPALLKIDSLPSSHVPQSVETLEIMPTTRTGKTDRTALLERYNRERMSSIQEGRATEGSCGEKNITARVVEVWKSCNVPLPSNSTDFWRAGGHSLAAMQMCAQLRIPSSHLFDGSLATVEDIVRWLNGSALERPIKNFLSAPLNHTKAELKDVGRSERIAIIGMAGRWPGIEQATADLVVKTLARGFEPLTSPPRHDNIGNISKGFYLKEESVRGFDLNFWNTHKHEAVSWDPQMRIFAEVCFEAMMDAGLSEVGPPGTQRGCAIDCGIFAAGGGMSHYAELLLSATGKKSLAELRVRDPGEYLKVEIGTDKDYLATRIAYMLNLGGPAEMVQTACSSGLVAVARAVDALRTKQCRTVLAGGVSVILPQQEHASRPGLIWSSDGRCRPFDADASGTANCNGAHVFVLKRLDDAIQDGDSIYACIDGIAVRNDGRVGKRDFTAPSSEGHERTIVAALKDAGKAPSDISMIEAHATGTLVGDPIEVVALTKAYGYSGGETLSLGSIKGNIGHANTAAGALSFAKAVSCVYSNLKFPSGSFCKLSPLVANELKACPRDFQVQTFTQKWSSGSRCAGVSALGIGGTNAHAVVSNWKEELSSNVATRPIPRFLCFSAQTISSLERYLDRFGSYLTDRDVTEADDIVFTLALTRPSLRFRSYVKLNVGTELSFHSEEPPAIHDTLQKVHVVLLFGGQGSNLPPAGSVHILDEFLLLLGEDPLLSYHKSHCPIQYQVALFCVQVSLGRQLLERFDLHTHNVTMIGHSLGEWVAATCAGVFPLDVALNLVISRAKLLIHHCSSGGMLSVCATIEEARDAIRKMAEASTLEIACHNRKDRVVLSGTLDDCREFEKLSGLVCKLVKTGGAFHSRFVEDFLPEFAVDLEKALHLVGSMTAGVRLVSTRTGSFVDESDLRSSEHWLQQTRGCVEFAKAVNMIVELDEGKVLWVDMGPDSRVMKSFVSTIKETSFVSLFDFEVNDDISPMYRIERMVFHLWQCGTGVVDLKKVVDSRGRKKILSFPPYVWDRTECWPDVRELDEPNNATRSFVHDDGISFLYGEEWNPFDSPGQNRQDVYTYWLGQTEEVSIARVLETGAIYIVIEAVEGKGVDVPVVQANRLGHFVALVQRILESISFPIVFTVAIVDTDVCSSAVLGAARSVMSEHPELGVRIIRSNTTTLYSHLEVPPGEYRSTSEDALLFRSLVSLPHTSGRFDSNILSTTPLRTTVLITGGLGGLGQVVCRWLVANHESLGVSRVLLTSRGTEDVVPAGLPSEMVAILSSCDVTSIGSVAQALKGHESSIACVFHCAGEVFDSLVNTAPSDASALLTQMSAKTQGLWNLLKITDSDTKIINFSSSSGALGSLGQLSYAAANTAIDRMLELTPSRESVSLQWGGWSSDIPGTMGHKFGITSVDSSEILLTEDDGVAAMLSALAYSKHTSRSLIMIADIRDWSAYSAAAGISRWSLTRLVRQPTKLKESVVVFPSYEQAQLMPEWRWIRDHTHESAVLVSGSCLLEILLTDGMLAEDISFRKPVRLGDKLRKEKCPAKITRLYNGNCCVVEGRISDDLVNISVTLRALLSAWDREGCGSSVQKCPLELYRLMRRGGFPYGAAFTLVHEIVLFDKIVLGCIQDKSSTRDGTSLFGPELDACTHLCAILDTDAAAAYPTGCRRIAKTKRSDIATLLTPNQVALLSRYEEGWTCICTRNPEGLPLEFDLVCVSQHIVITIEKLKLRALPRAPPDLVVLEWNDTGPSPVKVESKPPIFPDRGDFKVTVDANFAPSFTSENLIEPLKSDHIRIKVTAYGLNFLDVLAATGAMPSEYFGGECVGRVICVGADVSRFRVGDRVAAVLLGGFKTLVSIPATFAASVPDTVSDEEAATIPLAYTTAWLAIEWQARVREGEVALVHSAAGGVGLACVNLLKSKSCRVLATCSAGKEHVLEKLGINRSDIFPSRTVDDWVSGCVRNGVGISVCVGAFVGSSLERSLELMAPFGRIVDIGKRDQFGGCKISMGHFLKGLGYSAAHLDVLMQSYPMEMQRLNDEVWGAYGSTVAPLPFETYPLKDIRKAMERLSSGKMIGKVVVTMPDVVPENVTSTMVPQPNILQLIDPLSAAALEALIVSDTSNDLFIFPEAISDNHTPTYSIAKMLAESRKVAIVPRSIFDGPVPRSWFSAAKSVTAERNHGKLHMDMETWLLKYVCDATGVTLDVASKSSLESLGFDSLARLQLIHKLREVFPAAHSVDLSSTTNIKSLFHAKDKVQPAEKSSRWLMLHGFRMNTVIFKHQMKNILDECRLAGIVGEIDFISAPLAASGEGDVQIERALSDGTGVTEWWRRGIECGVGDCFDPALQSYENGWIGHSGLKESWAYLKGHIAQKKYDCVVGMSQGAGMAWLLTKADLVKRAILFSPVAPTSFQSIPDVLKNEANILAIWDESDIASDEFVKLHLSKDTPSVQHRRGHAVPQDVSKKGSDAHIVQAIVQWSVSKETPDQ